MKRKQKALTLIEMLVVLGIIATIAGLLIPATQAVRRHAKNTEQRVQLKNIETALEVFRQDFGEYPASNYGSFTGTTGSLGFSGAQKLAIAMMGMDLRGFDPATPLANTDADIIDNWYFDGQYSDFDNRQERYLDPGVARPFLLEEMVATSTIPGLYPTGTMSAENLANSYVLTDIFTYKPIAFTRNTQNDTITETRRAGSPILYFRANSSGSYNVPQSTGMYADPLAIYQYGDNQNLVQAKHNVEGKPMLPGNFMESDDAFYNAIQDPLVPLVSTSDRGMPYRADSYILISAGADGIYGTEDDINSFD